MSKPEKKESVGAYKQQIVYLHENAHKCRVCKTYGARLHSIFFLGSKLRYYCDCDCGKGTITDYYDTRDEAINAWNKRIEVKG